MFQHETCVILNRRDLGDLIGYCSLTSLILTDAPTKPSWWQSLVPPPDERPGLLARQRSFHFTEGEVLHYHRFLFLPRWNLLEVLRGSSPPSRSSTSCRGVGGLFQTPSAPQRFSSSQPAPHCPSGTLLLVGWAPHTQSPEAGKEKPNALKLLVHTIGAAG